MSRSPLSYPLNRGMDMDAGGAADLQTDVMRFMAIISLCLVAIFALVQSLPTPVSPPESAAKPQPEPIVVQTKEPERVRQPVPRREPPATKPPPVEPVQKPVPKLAALPPAPVYEAPAKKPDPPVKPSPLASAPPPVPVQAPAAPAAKTPARKGFSLRFESDLALTRLVARNEIGLYALQPGKAQRMSVNRGAVSFWPAGSPGQIHEMDESTVPDTIVAALRRSGGGGSLRWGVTLPAGMSRDLNRYLNEYEGGELIIGANGDLRLEH